MSYRMKKKHASMRVKKIEYKQKRRTCGECSNGEWNEENRNYLGETFLIYCEFGKCGFCRSHKKGVTYRDTEACKQFKERSENDVLRMQTLL